MSPASAAVKSVLVAMLAFAVLLVSTPAPKLFQDSLTAEAASQSAGPSDKVGLRSSMEGFNHGALWFRFLRMTRAVGLESEGQWVVITVLCALAVGLFYHLIKTRFPAHLAWPAAACFILLTASGTDRPFMFNPSIVPVFAVMLYYAMVEMVRTGSLVAAALCGVFLGCASAAHVAGLALTPIPVALALLFVPRWLTAVALVGLATALVLFIDSPLNFLSNLGVVYRSPGHVAATLVLSLCFLGAVVPLRQRVLAVPVERRGVWVMALAGICYPLLFVAASVTLGFPLDFGGRMVLPIIVPISYLGAVVTDRAARRLRAAGPFRALLARALPVTFLVLTFLIGWTSIPQGEVLRPAYSMNELTALVRHLEGSGRPIADVRRRLRGPGSGRLAYAFWPWAGQQSGAIPGDGPDLRVLKVAPGELPPPGPPADTETIELSFGKTLLLLPIESWVRAIPDRVCTVPTDGSFAASCLDEVEDGQPGSRPLGERAADEYARLHLDPHRISGEGDGDDRVRFVFHLPVDIRGGDEERTLELVDFDEDWRIERIDGVGFRGPLPARRVAITRNGASTGQIVVSVIFSKWGFWRTTKSLDFVEVLETRPAEQFLRGLPEPR